jgi:large subunit ribosomal protein L14
MVYKKTRLIALDNSGAREVEVIRVLRSKHQHAKVGDIIVVAVKRAASNKKVKKHDVKTAVVVQTVKKIYRKRFGMSISFDQNSVVIVGKGNTPIATRIKGPVTQELRAKNFMKIVSMAPSVI